MKHLWIIILSIITLTASAQKMQVEDFGRYRKPLFKRATWPTDKHQALLDLYTNETGFQFLADDTPVTATENDGSITLALPPRTNFLTISHPDYGQLTWRIPGKPLKKRKRYLASLHTESPDKEFHQQKQWALFTVDPAHAILYVDSSMYAIRDGHLSLYLPLGRHACRVESPFYTPLSDTIELTDTGRLEKLYYLEPSYAYLTVETALPDGLILLDGQPMGHQRIETGRLMPGRYRVSIRQGERLCYDRFIEIANAERKVVDLRDSTLHSLSTSNMRSTATNAQTPPRPDSGSAYLDSSPTPTNTGQDTLPAGSLADVHITTFDAETEIWLNREKIALGEWQGQLPTGFYAVSSRKEGLESGTRYFRVEAGKPVEIRLPSPRANYALLNISSDETGATVYLNGIKAGTTPCVLRDLPTNRSYRITLVKGDKSAERTLILRGNDIIDVNLQLHKKRASHQTK